LGKDSQISAIALFSDKEGFGVGSIDGRANLGSINKDNYTM